MTRSIAITGFAMAALLPSAVSAQMMPGMKMDHPKPATPVARPKAKRASHPSPSAAPPAHAGARSQSSRNEGQSADADKLAIQPRPAPGNGDGIEPPPPAPSPIQDTSSGHDMAAMADMPGMTMSDAPSPYGEGSGTARNPGNDGAMHGLHLASGDWTVMLHGYAWGVYTDQGGPRGRDEAFVESMAMLEGTRDLGDGTRLQLRSMLSLEPAMGAREIGRAHV